jgi:DNA-binding NarL/FixJ family response regulator
MSEDPCRGRILLLEDDARFASMLAGLLAAEGWEVEHVCGVEAARVSLEGSTPWLVIVDLLLPDGSGLDIVDRAAAAQPPIPTLVVTVYGATETVRSAISRGAVGFLLKDDPMADFALAVEACLSGDSPLSPAAARAIVEPMRDRAMHAVANLDHLTARERQVMSLLGSGLRYSEVADQLGIALGTVQTYVKRLYAKLDVNSKAEVAWLASEWKTHL